MRSGPPRVLLAVPPLGPRGGGIGRVCWSILKVLSARRARGEIDFRCVCLGGPVCADDDTLYQEWGQGRILSVGERRSAFVLASWWWMLSWADIAVFGHAGIASLMCPLPRALRPRTITWIHGIDVWGWMAYRKRLALEQSDLVISSSHFTAKRARDVHPWMPEAHVCHPGVEDGGNGEIPATHLAVPECGGHAILSVGRIELGESKGQQELIRSMQAIVPVIPDARLMLVGTGNGVKRLEELARESPAAHAIVFLGFVSEEALSDLYQRCAIFALPSTQEGFGLVFAEAMLAGLPCVASTLDAAGEVVLDGETGILVTPSTPGELEAALLRLLRDPALRKRMGECGRARARAHFMEKSFSERFWDELSGCLGRLDQRTG